MKLSGESWRIAVQYKVLRQDGIYKDINALVNELVQPLLKSLIDTSAMLAVYTEGRQIETTRTQALMALTEAFETIKKTQEDLK